MGVVGHRASDDHAQRFGGLPFKSTQSTVRREGVLQHEVEHRAGTVDVELRPVDLVDLHALHGEPDHLGIAEVLGAVRRERHRRLERRHEPEVDQMRCGVVHDDVVGLHVLVPHPAGVVAIERRDEVDRVADELTEVVPTESAIVRERMRLPNHRGQVVAGVVRHRVPEPRVVEFVSEHEPETPCGVERSALADDLRE